MKNTYVPVPEPKRVVSPRVKALTKKANELKDRMGIKGKIQAGDLITRSKEMSKKKLSILGLI